MEYYSLLHSITTNLKEYDGFVFNCYRKIVQKRSPPQLKAIERKHLCDDIVCKLFTANNQMRMDRQLFIKIAKQIVKVFPGEKEVEFYRVGKRAFGQLYSSYVHFRQLSKAAGYYTQNSEEKDEDVDEAVASEADTSEGDAKDVNFGEEDAEEVKTEETEAVEEDVYASEEPTTPANMGQLSLDADDQRHPTLAALDPNVVFKIAKKILILAKHRKVEALEVYLPLLKDSKIEDEALPGYNKEHMIAVALLVLPHLFPCRQFRTSKCGKKRIPVSKYEVQQMFLAHYKSIMEYDSAFKTSLATEDTPDDLSVQPRLAIVGELSAENYIIQVEETGYCMPTFLESFSELFKMYCAQNYEYPDDVKLPWTFCQQIFFGVYTDNDVAPSDLTSVIEDITIAITASHVDNFDKFFDVAKFLVPKS